MNTLGRRLLIGAALTVTVVLLVGAAGYALLAQRVLGTSMSPTLTDGELIAANPFDRRPGRFDLVLAQPSADTQVLVKRVIGLPGDRIEISRSPVARTGGGTGTGAGRGAQSAGPGPKVGPNAGPPRIRVSPAGEKAWYEVHTAGGSAAAGSWTTQIECCTLEGRLAGRPTVAVVPAGRYFLLGDNPDESIDSRAFGWIDASMVRAVVVGRVWPPAGLPGAPQLVAAR